MNPHADSVQEPSDEQALLGWTRYEKARKLNPAQWAELHQRNLRGENFDDMIDALPATTQPAQQDTSFDQRPLAERAAMIAEELDVEADRLTRLGRWGDGLLASGARVIEELLAEKQAAPSGEDNHG